MVPIDGISRPIGIPKHAVAWVIHRIDKDHIIFIFRLKSESELSALEVLRKLKNDPSLNYFEWMSTSMSPSQVRYRGGIPAGQPLFYILKAHRDVSDNSWVLETTPNMAAYTVAMHDITSEQANLPPEYGLSDQDIAALVTELRK